MLPIGAQPRGPRLLRQGGLETRPYKNLNPFVRIIDPEFWGQGLARVRDVYAGVDVRLKSGS
jgi:hypothetical protein